MRFPFWCAWGAAAPGLASTFLCFCFRIIFAISQSPSISVSVSLSHLVLPRGVGRGQERQRGPAGPRAAGPLRRDPRRPHDRPRRDPPAGTARHRKKHRGRGRGEQEGRGRGQEGTQCKLGSCLTVERASSSPRRPFPLPFVCPAPLACFGGGGGPGCVRREDLSKKPRQDCSRTKRLYGGEGGAEQGRARGLSLRCLVLPGGAALSGCGSFILLHPPSSFSSLAFSLRR